MSVMSRIDSSWPPNPMVSSSGCATTATTLPPSFPAHIGLSSITSGHLRAEIGELFDVPRRAGVMRADTFVLWCETEREGHLERFDGLHLPIEPLQRVGSKVISPAQAGAKMADAQIPQGLHAVFKPVVFKMEPLANSELGSEAGELPEGPLGTAIFADQPHVEVTIVRGAFRLAVTRGCGPCARKIETPTSETQMGNCVTALISSSFPGHS